MAVRQAVFAGSWYPDSASGCASEIKKYIKGYKGVTAQINDRINTDRTKNSPLTGGIVPHAGWYFSGAIACNVIHQLSLSVQHPDVAIIFGMHLHPDMPPHLMPEGEWETPFGPLPVHESLAQGIGETHDFRIESPDTFMQDNTIELQLPFVKYFYPELRLLALGVPPAPVALDIARTTVDLVKNMGLTPIILGSTDLTHYGSNYRFTPKGSGEDALRWVKDENDKRFIDALHTMNAAAVIDEALTHHNACCSGAAAAAVAACREMGATRATTIAYATSNDKKPGDNFVGYAGVLFS